MLLRETIGCFTPTAKPRHRHAVCPRGFWGYRDRLGMLVGRDRLRRAGGLRARAGDDDRAVFGSLGRRARVSGVIGTEITVFEPLARDFAEAYFERFLAGAPVGAALRGARPALLARGDPLGSPTCRSRSESLRLLADSTA